MIGFEFDTQLRDMQVLWNGGRDISESMVCTLLKMTYTRRFRVMDPGIGGLELAILPAEVGMQTKQV